MVFGLTDDEKQFLNDHLITPLKKLGCKVFIFGSRATAKHKKFSDIDITYKASSPIQPHQIFKLIEFMENSKFIYKIDLVNFDEIATSYKAKIESEMVEV